MLCVSVRYSRFSRAVRVGELFTFFTCCACQWVIHDVFHMMCVSVSYSRRFSRDVRVGELFTTFSRTVRVGELFTTFFTCACLDVRTLP